jgi:hypothetical protein
MSVVVHGWWLKLRGAIVVEVFVLAIENHQMGCLGLKHMSTGKRRKHKLIQALYRWEILQMTIGQE